MLLVLIFFPLRNVGGDPIGDGGNDPVGDETYLDFRLPRFSRRPTFLQRSILLSKFQFEIQNTKIFLLRNSLKMIHLAFNSRFKTQKLSSIKQFKDDLTLSRLVNFNSRFVSIIESNRHKNCSFETAQRQFNMFKFWFLETSF